MLIEILFLLAAIEIVELVRLSWKDFEKEENNIIEVRI